MKIENQNFEEIEKNFVFECQYKLFFHPSSVWKILFLKIRKNCVENEHYYEMQQEYYWMNGFLFSFINKNNQKKVIVNLEIIQNNKNKRNDENNFLMKVVIKADENPQKIFDEMHLSVKEFISRWISASKSKQIEFSLSRKSFEKEESIKLIEQEQQNNIEIENNNIISSSSSLNKIKKEIIVCAFCGCNIPLGENRRECEICLSKHFLVENQFAIIRVVAQGKKQKFLFIIFYIFNFIIYFINYCIYFI
jgi:hypothetical protein